jgi:hypothetical protein
LKGKLHAETHEERISATVQGFARQDFLIYG